MIFAWSPSQLAYVQLQVDSTGALNVAGIGGGGGVGLTDAQLRLTPVPMSLASLPLPTGAATAALQTTGNVLLANLDTPLSTRLKPADTLAGVTLVGALTSITNPVGVTGTFWQATQPVSGAFFQATQPVSLTSLPVGHNIIDSGSITVANASLAVTGTFWQSTQPVSAASLPLPTGASTSALQTTGNASLANLDAALSTRLKPGDTLTGVTTVTTITNPVAVTGTFFQATQPISAAALPLPANAAMETGGNLAAIANIDFATGSRQDAMLGIAQALAQLILNCDTSSVTIAGGQITISAMPTVNATVQGSVAVLSHPLPPNAAQETAGNLDLISAALLRLNTAISNLDVNMALQNRLMASLIATHGGSTTDYIN